MPKTLNLDEAKQCLNQYNRWTLSDGTFGGSEVGWTDDNGKNIALAWFEGCIANIGVDTSHPLSQKVAFKFEGEDARELRFCGKSSSFLNNDESDDTNATMLRSDPDLAREPALCRWQ